MASGRVRGQTFILNFLVVAQGPLQPEPAHHPQASGPAGELGGRLLHPSAWYSRTRTPTRTLRATTRTSPGPRSTMLHLQPGYSSSATPAVEELGDSVVTSASPTGRERVRGSQVPTIFLYPAFQWEIFEPTQRKYFQ